MPFNDEDYLFVNSPKNGKMNDKMNEEDEVNPRSYLAIEWAVSDFVTNDFCDCLLVPVINFEKNLRIEGEPSSIFTKYRD